MASSSATATADTLISLKVNLNGSTRRFKLPLRDVGANVFEDKVRAFLQIPIDATAVIERYSDSATSYVILTQTNIAVYKQLYRAAKAKQKLKLRVTTEQTEPAKEIPAPKPVTVEDEIEERQSVTEPYSQSEVQPETQKEPEPEPSRADNETAKVAVNDAPTGVIETVTAPRTSRDFPSFVKQWRARGNPRIHLRRDTNGIEVIDFLGPSTTAEPLITRDIPEGLSSTTLADLMREACERELATIKRREARAKTMKEFMVKSAARSNRAEPMEFAKSTTPVMKQNEQASKTEVGDQPECVKLPFTVCCNSCDRAVPEAHFHCSICDEGDFDLCQECVNRGISCYDDGHWLIRRAVIDGDMKCSSTHIAPKSVRPIPAKTTPSSDVSFSNLACRPRVPPIPSVWNLDSNARTCNCCVQEFREAEFVHCTTCDDYDLCKSCFAKNQHGHHPKHGFAPAVKGTLLDQHITSRLTPGRNVLHNAICDGCDKYIRGIRHKCLDCPDWDYCSDCVNDASFIHANHRFVAIYEPLGDRPFRASSRATHYGISCDGPLCSARDSPRYIVGERYKCAVCHDTDFCANCEASPANTHNKTHPLIKFKTPVRHVSVTTTGEHEDGQRLPTMGDRCPRSRASTQSVEKPASPMENIVSTPVQTVVDVQPTEQTVMPVPSQSSAFEIKEEKVEDYVKAPEFPVPVKTSVANDDLVAVFKWDTIRDGSILPPNHTFEQTWVLRNEGTVPWPAGCAVKFVGGDYMGAIDPAHPAGIHELVSASESTVCYNPLSPGQEFPFTVLMRTPDRDGKVISYWRLTTPDGAKFGHKLWCDVDVLTPRKAEQVKAPVAAVVESDTEVEETAPASISESRMIIPKLEHESPSGSIHEGRSEIEPETGTDTLAPSVGSDNDDDYEDCGGQDDWAEESDNGFFTDEEYDILDASDEEFLFEQQKMLSKN
ncbi:hypothetical protein GGS24DRAFT_475569 [Hypoxylon argillaceum]|nr:hypothetical protein GGS24DRAFT_475569 [Hypoxylon argillaceum]